MTPKEQTLEKKAALVTLGKKVNDHLTLRTFLAGHRLSLADLAIWALLKQDGGFDAVGADAVHLHRWRSFLEAQDPIARVLGSSSGGSFEFKPAQRGGAGMFIRT